MKPLFKAALLCVMLFAGTLLFAESWTVLVYMAADNGLAQMGKLDINSMESVVQPANLNLIVQADFPEGAKRYRIQQDDSENITSPVISNLGNIDSGNPQTLNQFLAWGFAAYPSQRKMLVIWSHGDSWYKGKDKWICPDDSSENLMSISSGDLAIAFDGTPHLDILLFDACSMQSIEVINEVAAWTNYVIGSEELVPQYGFPYERIIPLFSADLATILNQIPALYVQSYLPGEGINSGNQVWTTTCSVIDTNWMLTFYNSFIPAMQLFWQIAEQLQPLRQQCYEMNTGMADVDLRQFLQLLTNAYPNLTMVSGLQTLWNQMVVSSDFSHPDPAVQNIGTAALWFPDSRFNFNNAWQRYQKLKFAKTQWLTLINKMLGDDIPPGKPTVISQYTVFSTLYLRVENPADPDYLYYRIKLSTSEYVEELYPSALWETRTLFAIPITAAGDYQLWAVDRSGNQSEKVSASFGWTEPQVSMLISPNPVRGKSLASLSWWADAGLSGKAVLELYNYRGQKLLREDLGDVASGEGCYLLSANPGFVSLPSGRYFLRLRLGEKVLTDKLTILY